LVSIFPISADSKTRLKTSIDTSSASFSAWSLLSSPEYLFYEFFIASLAIVFYLTIIKVLKLFKIISTTTLEQEQLSHQDTKKELTNLKRANSNLRKKESLSPSIPPVEVPPVPTTP
jgi:hypothetical protein